MDYSIIKVKTETATIFIVKDSTGRAIGQRSTKSRPYVACLVSETPASARVLHQAWFTNESLRLFNLGRGAQGRVLSGNIKLATL